MKKSKCKGFLMLENIVALLIAISGVLIFSLVVIDGRKTEKRLQEKTDRALAMRMIKQNKLSKVKIHDQVYYLGD